MTSMFRFYRTVVRAIENDFGLSLAWRRPAPRQRRAARFALLACATLALLFFNVGVEIGQLIFIVVVLLLMAAGTRVAASMRLSSPAWLWRVPPYAIGGLASYWVFERVAGF